MTRDEKIKLVCETIIGFSTKSDYEIIAAVKTARELLAGIEEASPEQRKCLMCHNIDADIVWNFCPECGIDYREIIEGGEHGED